MYKRQGLMYIFSYLFLSKWLFAYQFQVVNKQGATRCALKYLSLIHICKLKLNQLYFKDTSFVNLMTKRIFNVLLVANPYDAFLLEDDGRIDEKIFNEYMNLSLRYPCLLYTSRKS